jgi:hypothetical protein
MIVKRIASLCLDRPRSRALFAELGERLRAEGKLPPLAGERDTCRGAEPPAGGLPTLAEALYKTGMPWERVFSLTASYTLFATDPRIIAIVDRVTDHGGLARREAIRRAWDRETAIRTECEARAAEMAKVASR